MKVPKTFRFEQSLIARLEERAKEERLPATAIVDRALRNELERGGVAPEVDEGTPFDQAVQAVEQGEAVRDLSGGPASPPAEPSEAAVGPSNGRDTVGLDTWLSARTGQPVALCSMFVSQGRVEIDGEVASGWAGPRGLLEGRAVTFDGEPV